MSTLSGIGVVELAARGPGPFCGQILADMGADVVCVERMPIPRVTAEIDVSRRGKKAIAIDLKRPAGVDVLLRLLERTDVLVEGYRPGVMERLGLGPDVCLARNPALIYGRATGWGQTGPLAHAAGQDINYIALSGALHAMGPAELPPVPPLNLVGDLAAGGMLLAIGILGACVERQRSGKGQVIDAAMTDGAALMMGQFFTRYREGSWTAARGRNFADGGSHFYGAFETGDGLFVSIAAMQPEFYSLLVDKLELDPQRYAAQRDPARWPALKAELAALFRTRTRDEWCSLLEGTDVGFAPVLSLMEAPHHHHNQARATFIEVDGMLQPAPAPRFSRTPSSVHGRGRAPGTDTSEVLRAHGYTEQEIAALAAERIIEVRPA